MLAATADGLFAIDDDGVSTRLFAGTVDAVTRGANGDAWAIAGGHDLLRVEGADIEKVAHTADDLTCVVATAGDVFAGTVGAHVLKLDGGTLTRVESFDRLDHRDEWTQPWGAPGDARSFATDGRDTVFVNVHVGGVLRTNDRGATWEPTIDHEVDVHQVVLAPDGRLFAATGVAGLAVSTDGGTTWRFESEGLRGTYARAVAPVPGGVVVSASNGPFTHEGSVYRKDDGDPSFRLCDIGLPPHFDGNIDSHWLAAKGGKVACAAPSGTVYRSDDAGETWQVLAGAVHHPNAILVMD